MRLLIVEDDRGLAELERGLAADIGMDCDIAYDGASARDRLLGDGGVDIALVDYGLPDMSAPDLRSAVEAGGRPFPAFVITTGAGDERLAVAMMRLGARDYLVKDETFLELLPEALSRVRRELETERCLVETKSALEDSERHYRLIAENSSDAIFVYDPESRRFTYMSPSLSRLTDLDDGALATMRMASFLDADEYLLLKADLDERLSSFRSGDDSRKVALYRASVVRPVRGRLRMEVLTTLFRNDSGGVELLGVGRDVEERTRMEEALTRSLREKEVLLKEVHHRVKNNLQIVSSLMNLQQMSVRDPSAASALLDSQNRVRAMALIHEQLYRSPNLADISFSDYVRGLVSMLCQNVEIPVDVVYDLADATLSIDTAVPCGLILNELVTNALKHAFADVERPRLSVSFASEGGLYRLSVSDNGPGMAVDLSAKEGKSLGLVLVSALADQLSAAVSTKSEKGTTISIAFPASAGQAGPETQP